VAPPALPALVGVALVEGVRSRRRRRARPRLLWGPTPLISLKYWSAAMRERGYESRTLADGLMSINRWEDFDVHRSDFLGRAWAWEAVRDFVVFAWGIRNADVFLTFLDGGLLRHTALWRLEGPLLRLAGKRLIVFPYGSDVAVPGYLGVMELPLLADYPEIATRAESTRHRVDYFCRWANLVVRNHQYGYLPRTDAMWPTQMAVDTELWKGDGRASAADGVNGDVIVVHAPNHRHIKGTQLLLDAVQSLQDRGLRVVLDLIERSPNEVVRAAVHRCDIVAEQFLAGFGIFAIEGSAAGKPVLSALGWWPPEIRDSELLRDCPFVDVNALGIEVALEQLVTDPARREAVGRAGRRFAVERCSYDATGRAWTALIDHVWSGVPLPGALLPPGDRTH
jgi:glycosyltransferase involved in cell wall biosynthesis